MNNTAPQFTRDDEIQVLQGLQAVRLRPGMYIGGTDKRALTHCFREIFDNSVDEHLSRDASGNPHCSLITVTLRADGETLSVEDNGRGISPKVHSSYQAEGTTELELAVTRLHAGAKFDDKNYEGGSGGLHGVGAACVNAVSTNFLVEVWRDGGYFKQSFSRGDPLTRTERVGNSLKRGTRVTFRGDPEIFTDGIDFNEETLIAVLRESAMLNASLRVVFVSESTGRAEDFCYTGGIADYVTYLSAGRAGLYPPKPIYAKSTARHAGTGKNIVVEVAAQWSESEDAEINKAFANRIVNPDGGTHVAGFKTAFTRVVNTFARSSGALKEKQDNFTGDEVREGLTSVISVQFPQPQFESQTKVKLVSAEVEGAVTTVAGEMLTAYFEKNPSIVTQVCKRALTARAAREAARKAVTMVKRQSAFKSTSLSKKLMDCHSNDRDATELYIVEGDSAAGTAANARDPQIQAVLALGGKIINAEKHDMERVLKSEEPQDIIAAIGTGVVLSGDRTNFDYGKLRYGKIILSTDADIDGAHIATLLMTFFYRFMPDVILGGHVYIANPPLFCVKMPKIQHFAMSQAEMSDLMRRYPGAEVTRFKGLGEMDADQYRETVMDKKNRRLTRLVVPDMADAERMFGVLMGSDVAARKEHIIAKSHLRANQQAR